MSNRRCWGALPLEHQHCAVFHMFKLHLQLWVLGMSVNQVHVLQSGEESAIAEHWWKAWFPQLLCEATLLPLRDALQLRHRCNPAPSNTFQANLAWNHTWFPCNCILYHVQYLQQANLWRYIKQLIGNTYVIKYKILRHLITRSLAVSILVIIWTWYFASCLEILYSINSLANKHLW